MKPSSLDVLKMENEIILLPSLQEKLGDRRLKSHAKIILALLGKLKTHGKGALKILDVADQYLLCEMKVMRPPYRLYVIVDQSANKFYAADWEHKERQRKIIDQLRYKMSLAVKSGLENVFT